MTALKLELEGPEPSLARAIAVCRVHGLEPRNAKEILRERAERTRTEAQLLRRIADAERERDEARAALLGVGDDRVAAAVEARVARIAELVAAAATAHESVETTLIEQLRRELRREAQ